MATVGMGGDIHVRTVCNLTGCRSETVGRGQEVGETLGMAFIHQQVYFGAYGVPGTLLSH